MKKLYYSLTAGNLNNVFAVNPETGEIKVSGNLDYETRQHYTLTLTASDGAYTNTTTVQITVKDVNDNPPGTVFFIDKRLQTMLCYGVGNCFSQDEI